MIDRNNSEMVNLISMLYARPAEIYNTLQFYFQDTGKLEDQLFYETLLEYSNYWVNLPHVGGLNRENSNIKSKIDFYCRDKISKMEYEESLNFGSIMRNENNGHPNLTDNEVKILLFLLQHDYYNSNIYDVILKRDLKLNGSEVESATSSLFGKKLIIFNYNGKIKCFETTKEGKILASKLKKTHEETGAKVLPLPPIEKKSVLKQTGDFIKKTRVWSISVLTFIALLVTILPFFGIHTFWELMPKSKTISEENHDLKEAGVNKEDRNKKIFESIQAYANDLNNKKFDAYKYFAPKIDRFFQMLNTSPKDINTYVNGQYNQQFKNAITKFDKNTLSVSDMGNGEYQAIIIMYSTYYNVKQKKQYKDFRSRTELKFDSNFRIKYFRQFFD